jgi:hypothetical protein
MITTKPWTQAQKMEKINKIEQGEKLRRTK